MFNHEQLDHVFTYHSPSPEQIPKYQAIRDSAKELSHIILEFTPTCPSQTTAIQLLRQAVMVANQAIATGL
jgi:hypothetical protein